MDDESWREIGDSILKKEGTTLIQSFLDAGLDVNALDVNGITMMTRAIQCDNMEVIEFLVQNGADANIANRDGSKPIHQAAFYGYKHIVKFFINTGIDIECRDDDDWTLLHYSSHGGHLDLVKYLVSLKCAIESESSSGSTPLFVAVENNHFDIVEYLAESGADVFCPERIGWGVLHAACLEEASLDIVKCLLKKGCDPNAQTRAQNTPLHLALEDNLEIIEHLLKAGADCNIENVNGQTPFSLFIKSPRCLESTIELCLENGAYFNSDIYNFIITKPLLKEGILKDVKLSTQSLVNKFNFFDLPKVYEIPELAQRLPRIEKMKIPSHSNREQKITDCVNYEIQTKGYCNVLNVHPICLYYLCVGSLIQRNGN